MIRGLVKKLAVLLPAAAGLCASCRGARSGPPPTAVRPGSTPATQSALAARTNILFLHHSTGAVIWSGGVADALAAYTSKYGKDYKLTELAFPKESPYGWNNYPYDYWNIWVKHAGPNRFQDEPTLEMLTQQYQVIVWKHCFPVSNVEADIGSPDVASSRKSVENYKLQYAALKDKMRQFPATRFIVWTGAALVKSATNAEQAERARSFFDWVKSTWDEPGDNISIWDFRQLETEGGLYLLPGNAASASDAHPNQAFAQRVAPLLAQRVVDVIEGRGDTGSLTGG